MTSPTLAENLQFNNDKKCYDQHVLYCLLARRKDVGKLCPTKIWGQTVKTYQFYDQYTRLILSRMINKELRN